MSLNQTQIKNLMDPILDVFGGADGGVAFARLRFDFLPEMVEAAEKNQMAADLITTVERFSKLCTVMLETK